MPQILLTTGVFLSFHIRNKFKLSNRLKKGKKVNKRFTPRGQWQILSVLFQILMKYGKAFVAASLLGEMRAETQQQAESGQWHLAARLTAGPASPQCGHFKFCWLVPRSPPPTSDSSSENNYRNMLGHSSPCYCREFVSGSFWIWKGKLIVNAALPFQPVAPRNEYK